MGWGVTLEEEQGWGQALVPTPLCGLEWLLFQLASKSQCILLSLSK